jgi:phospholipid transport system substrate-binding protein
MKAFKFIVNMLAAAALSLPFAVLAETVPPDVLVKQTADEVIEVVKNDKDIQAGDLRKITSLAEAKILPHFDFERMSRMVLGKHWHKASKEQQAQFVSEFRALLIRTYASALAKYSNQTIEYKPLRAQPGDTEVTVKTQVLQQGTQPLPIDYTLAKKGEAWKVFDVTIEGVSLVTNYRGQFATEVKQTGIDGLIQRLVEKNKQLSTASNTNKS